MPIRVPRRVFGPFVLALACSASLALSACQTVGNLLPGEPASPPPATADTIGAGSVKVALLLPASAGGNGAATATAFRNAADLALRDFPKADITIAIYDTGGDAAGAQAALGRALQGGSELILGPVFSAEVAAIAPQARAAGVPVVAFSSDANVAGPGVYLLSFLPSDDVNRIVGFSASQGRKSFAALLPDNSYGGVVEAAFRTAVAANGGRIVAIERYEPSAASIAAKATAIGRLGAQVDALLVPDSGDAMPEVAAALAAAGVNRTSVQFLGSGQWDDPRILNSPALVGGWFPAPARQGFESFAQKYQAAFGAVPPRNATLGYDAAVLAAGLVRRFGNQRFDLAILTSANGYKGIDGVFRFLPSGITERRLSVFEVTGSGSREIAPASASFATGT